ncbi:hypothetical protein Ae201684P_013304 [Aphanomyces euteiches]|uniref:HAT C-terminal dimerisation domain-containing protein n=1 Tax=Aphanomyces euteiches TaxID=100861 RepID=A0A6G0WS14_9STRA|nr:hypothetical protein Ae201684_012272 [Aphanomyces euteiches]KAH9096638.1 hypothetical protein Ae201684P_013304 [Aphanomyces euteiches]KAH9132252.1 hypothetical protein AeRB84_021294 [Aphanomyces euteiches]KAH9135764.1 hypothetical protein AeRB84_018915 [Aphanomyces euteiches]KAH9137070.1 hypothetical protein AeRB84_018026 [Aphanomyces euteiches]
MQVVDERTQTLFTATLFVQELFGRATTKAVYEEMKKCLDNFGLDERQIYSITTDNGSNVARICELIDAYDDISDTDDDGTEINGWDRALDGVAGVRCAMHTLQLAITAAVDNSIDKVLIKKVRQIVKKCQTTTIRQRLVERNVPLPTLDVITRWGSLYDMLSSCLHIKEDIDNLFAANDSLTLSSAEWEGVENILSSLEPARKCTGNLQKRSLLAGDFLAEWMVTKRLLVSIGTPLSIALVEFMVYREAQLFASKAFPAAVLVDLRYQTLLKKDQKEIAMSHLISTYHKIYSLKQRYTVSSPSQSQGTGDVDNEVGNEK